MAKFFRARRAREVRAFLETRGFSLLISHGDDDIYERKGFGFTVKIPNRDNEEISDGTISQIRKCIRMCGIDDKEMLKWWKDNDYAE